jgi:heme-degrading monooxygenase HmoA
MVKAGSESRYEAWLKEVTPIAQTFPGHRGVNFIRPPKGSRSYTTVLHFDTIEHPRGGFRLTPASGSSSRSSRTSKEAIRWRTRPALSSGSRHRTQSRSRSSAISSSWLRGRSSFLSRFSFPGSCIRCSKRSRSRLASHQQSYRRWYDRRPPDVRYHAALHALGRDMAVESLGRSVGLRHPLITSRRAGESRNLETVADTRMRRSELLLANGDSNRDDLRQPSRREGDRGKSSRARLGYGSSCAGFRTPAATI